MPNDRPRGLPTVGDGCTTILGPGKSSVRQAREAVRKWLAEYGLQDLVDIAELLVSELATNAVVHAGGRYRLTLSLGVGTLRCEVADERRNLPRPPHRRAENEESPHVDPDSENGRGLLLVDALAHRWGSRLVEEGKEVWFELQLDAVAGTVDAGEADVHHSAPPGPRPETSTGCAERDHERTDHHFGPDDDCSEDLGVSPVGGHVYRRVPSREGSAPSATSSRVGSHQAAAHRHTPSQPTANSQPPTTSVNQCTPRYTRVSPTSTPQQPTARQSEVRPCGERTHIARITSPAVTAAVVVWPEGNDQPEACPAQSPCAGR
jgi:anti-sigma regulatory factor (Ser/Thr protein kinase)